MNAAQIRHYRCLVRDWRLARVRRNLPAGDVERYALHRRALGYDKSSANFTQAEFDTVKGALLAESKPADLNAQIRQIEQPEERRKALIARSWAAMRSSLTYGSEAQFQRAAQAYADSTAKRIHGKGIDDLNEAQLAVVMGALERSAAVKAKKREATGENGGQVTGDGGRETENPY